MTSDLPGDHLDELLSAFVDGELAGPSAARADDHLARCLQCRTDLDAILAARHLVRGLPGRLPPAGWYHAVVRVDARRARMARRTAGTVAVMAAATALGLVVLPAEPAVAPPLHRLVDTHAAGSSITNDPVTSVAPVAVPAGLSP